jgi:hypothetical protein
MLLCLYVVYTLAINELKKKFAFFQVLNNLDPYLIVQVFYSGI